MDLFIVDWILCAIVSLMRIVGSSVSACVSYSYFISETKGMRKKDNQRTQSLNKAVVITRDNNSANVLT